MLLWNLRKITVRFLLSLSVLQIIAGILGVLDWWPRAMNWVSGVPSLWVLLSIAVPTVWALILLWDSERLKTNGLITQDDYDMSAHRVGRYISKHLKLSNTDVNKLITELFLSGSLSVRGVEDGSHHFSPIPPNSTLYVSLSDDEVISYLAVGFIMGDGGSSFNKHKSRTHTHLVFISREIKKIVREQKISMRTR